MLIKTLYRNLLIGLCFSPLLTLSAQEKYPSLFWEIKKTPQSEASYLYGTMHVSSKLAFHLTDEFYKNIREVDIIGLETDPSQWLDKSKEQEIYPSMENYGFYRTFQHEALDVFNFAQQLASDHAMVNGLLYRSSSANQDFEEDTYLDMFIYQSGAKFNKPIAGLEDFHISSDKVAKAYSKRTTKDPIPQWLQDLFKDKPYYLLLQDAYRNNDLDFIDSLNQGLFTEDYNKYMLVDRNETMANSIDSIIKTGKRIFSGIGAAHLPGNDGVIEMLRDRGYIMKPIIGTLGDKGKKIKEEIENTFVKRDFVNYTSSDGMLSFPSPSKVHEVNFGGKTMLLIPDMTNGSYIAVSRIKIHDFARKENDEKIELKELDKILIEAIPGKIESKVELTLSGHSGLEIKSKTKAGDHHRYAIFQTPLEVIIIKMVGKRDYVKQEGDKLFKHIKLKAIENKWETIEPKQKQISIQLPDFHSIDNNDSYTSQTGSPQIYAYSPDSKAYFFVQEKHLSDVSYLEEDAFELNRIHQMYYKELDMDSFDILDKSLRLEQPFLASENKENNIKLQGYIKGQTYYLLGTHQATDEESKRFFDSFKIQNQDQEEAYTLIDDTVMHFTVEAPFKPYYRNKYQGDSEEREDYERYEKNAAFFGFDKQYIQVEFAKYNDFHQYLNLDSLGASVAKDYEGKTMVIEKQLSGYKDDTYPYLDFLITDTATQRCIRLYYILSNGARYRLTTMLDRKDADNHVFINKIFSTFTPKDTVLGLSPFQNKSTMFFDRFNSESDSVKDIAKEIYNMVEFTVEDENQLIETIETYDFEDDDQDIKRHLISAFSNLKTKDRESKLKAWYLAAEDNSDLQLFILRELSKDGSKGSFGLISELIKQDIPLPYNSYQIPLFFTALEKHPELEVLILDDLLDLMSVHEYQSPVISSLKELLEEGELSPKALKSLNKQFLAMAKVETKRARSAKISQNSYNSTDGSKELMNLMSLLIHRHKDKNTQVLFEKVKASKLDHEYMFLLSKLLKQGVNFDAEAVNNYAKDTETRADLYEYFFKAKVQDQFPEAYSSLDSISYSYVKERFASKTDQSIEFYQKRDLDFESKTATIFVYKRQYRDYSNKAKTDLVYTIYLKGEEGKPETSSRINDDYIEGEDEKLEEAIEGFLLQNRERVIIGDNSYNRFGF